MTQSFDEWKEEQESIHNDYDAENAWYAGAQSKQSEIDDHIKRRLELAKEKQGLINEIDELRKQVTGQARTAQNQQATIYELRKRIDDAIERSNHAHIGYQMLYKQFDDVIDILKGKTNEQ